MHRELPRERGLHNQAAEGEGDKKLPSRSFHTPLPSILHFQRAAFDGQQHLLGKSILMGKSIFSAAICSRWQQQAGCHPCPHAAGGQQCCYPLSIPLSLRVFLLVVGQEGGRMFPHQDGSVTLSFVSPSSIITLRISAALAQPLCSPAGKDPHANSKSSHQIVFLPRGSHTGAGWSLESR